MRHLLFSALSTALLFGISPLAGSAGSGTPTVYMLEPDGVHAYDAATGKKAGFIVQGHAASVAVDAARNVYVGVFSASPLSFVINEFAPGNPKPIRQIAAEQQNAELAVYSPTGEVAVAGSEGGNQPNYLLFFLPGQSRASRVISSWSEYGYVAYDGAGNCWVDGTSHRKTLFGYVPQGAKTVTTVPLEGSPDVGAFALDAKGNIVAAVGGKLEVFATNGKLLATVPLQGEPSGTVGLAVSPDDSLVYVASQSYGQVVVYRYPSGGAPLRGIGRGPFRGVLGLAFE